MGAKVGEGKIYTLVKAAVVPECTECCLISTRVNNIMYKCALSMSKSLSAQLRCMYSTR